MGGRHRAFEPVVEADDANRVQGLRVEGDGHGIFGLRHELLGDPADGHIGVGAESWAGEHLGEALEQRTARIGGEL
jgi:hypothetical protein